MNAELKKRMEDLSDICTGPLPADSPYVRPFRFHYTQAGRRKNWDLLEVHDSVAVIVYNRTRHRLVMVKQFRPAIYYNAIDKPDRHAGNIDTSKYPASLGVALELCAGIVDKDKTLEEIAREEVLEECGYNVEVKDLQRVKSYRSGVGVQGALQTLYYCEVTDDQKTEKGGGVDDEIIEVVEYSIAEIEELLDSSATVCSPPSCLYGLSWFLLHKAEKLKQHPT